MDKDKIKEKVKQEFTDYLSQKGCRKTPERYAILDLIYSESKHFDMETLYQEMHNRHFRVSRATLYNTMQLLQECKLVLKHQFGNNLSCYEKAYNNDFHYHLICTHCYSIQEYKDKDMEIRDIIQQKKIKKFTPSHHSLYIFGICNQCNIEIKRQKKAKSTNKTKDVDVEKTPSSISATKARNNKNSKI